MGYGYVNRDDSVRSKTIVRKISDIIIQFVCENLYASAFLRHCMFCSFILQVLDHSASR